MKHIYQEYIINDEGMIVEEMGLLDDAAGNWGETDEINFCLPFEIGADTH